MADTYDTPGTYDWTSDDGAPIQIECWGGGCKGSDSLDNPGESAGGGGGGYSKTIPYTPVIGRLYQIVVDGNSSGLFSAFYYVDEDTLETVYICLASSAAAPPLAGTRFGGTTASAVGDVKYAGGDGYADNTELNSGGGGSSAGPGGAGTSATDNVGAIAPSGGGDGGDGGYILDALLGDGHPGIAPGGGGGGAIVSGFHSGGLSADGKVIIGPSGAPAERWGDFFMMWHYSGN